MNPESRLIQSICKSVFHKRSNDDIVALLKNELIDWRLLKCLIGYHELVPLFYLAIKDCKELVPETVFQFLLLHYYYTVADNLKKNSEYQIIYCAFREREIPLLPIKGIALLDDIYAENFMRPMADIDVLIKEDDLVKAQDLLYSLGYEKKLLGLEEAYWLKKQCHLTFCKKEVKNFSHIVELHWGLDFKRKNRNILPELWNRVREIQIDKRNISLLSSEDTLFSLALHQRRFGRTLGLKNVIDAGLLLNKYKNDIDWGYLLREAKNGKMRSTLFFILSQVKFLLGKNIPSDIWKELKIPFWARRSINRFIEKNTFFLERPLKNLYLKSHFLLYDSFWEPVEYVLNIPKEQFAKFYSLKAYDRKTDFLYLNRFIYTPFKFIHNFFVKTN